MSGDYSRERFDHRNDFSGILQQQGKVLLDANANELVRIYDRRTRAQTTDTFGRAVVPRQTPEGFKIDIVGTELTIGPGRIYVDGLLAENHGASPLAFDPALCEDHGLAALAYADQPYLPDAMNTAPPPREGGPHLVYLVVHERELTYLERPALLESAIGLDTVTALQTVWQVRVLPNVGAGVTCATPDDQIPGWTALTRPSAGRLTTGAVAMVEPQSPCELESSGGYRGLENQLYRIEIHDGGKVGTATFKWSRDNGSVATNVLSIKGPRLTVARTGLDAVLRFSVGDWVEIIDEVRELTGRPGEIRRVHDVVDETQVIELDSVLPAAEFADGDVVEARRLRIRRWDQKGRVRDIDGKTVVQLDAAGSAGVIPVLPTGTKVQLEHGVWAMFDVAAPDGEFRTGDYWTVAARIATASVEALTTAPPRGIHRHYCRLAVVTFPATAVDCRILWPPEAAAETGCACTVCVSPAQHENQRPSLQAAIDEVTRAGGGTICLDVGEYHLRDPLRLDKARSIRITGKGTSSVLMAETGGLQILNGSDDVALDNFAVVSRGGADLGAALSIFSSSHVRLEHLRLRVENPLWSAIALGGALQGTTIRDNILEAADGIRSVNDPFAFNVAFAGTGLSDFRVEDNEFNCSNAGVRLDGVSVHQFVSRIATNRFSGCRQAGIVVTGATAPGFAVEVSGNECAVLGDGIVAGLDGVYVPGNNVHVGHERPLDRQRGIVMTRTAVGNGLGDGRIVDNRVAGFVQGIAVDVPFASLTIARNRIGSCQIGVLVAPERMGTLVIAENQISDIVEIGMRVRSQDTSRVSALGNAVDRYQRGPGVLLECPRSECIVAENQVQPAVPVDAPGILVIGRTAAANANRLIGRGLRLEITVDPVPQPLATVLGNITGGEIVLNGSPLTAPWPPFNHRFVV